MPGIPWGDIAGLRNRVVHGYDRVDFDIVWQTIVDDLPPLISRLETFLTIEPEPAAEI